MFFSQREPFSRSRQRGTEEKEDPFASACPSWWKALPPKQENQLIFHLGTLCHSTVPFANLVDEDCVTALIMVKPEAGTGRLSNYSGFSMLVRSLAEDLVESSPGFPHGMNPDELVLARRILEVGRMPKILLAGILASDSMASSWLHLPKSCKNIELALQVVAVDGLALAFLGTNNRENMLRLVEAAVRQNGRAIRYARELRHDPALRALSRQTSGLECNREADREHRYNTVDPSKPDFKARVGRISNGLMADLAGTNMELFLGYPEEECSDAEAVEHIRESLASGQRSEFEVAMGFW